MLDLRQPTRLYEAGALIDPASWWLRPLRHGLPLERRAELDELLEIEPMHYNGWWMFAVPLAALDRVGLPMPCFIRGDDVEFGRRLHDAGLHTVSLPGIAIWHEPFYAKLNNWQLYYETRNLLVTAALHFPCSPPALAKLLLKRLLGHLLAYRYYSAALILRGIDDYLRGPELFRGHPSALHAALDQVRDEHSPVTTAREAVAWPAAIGPDPRGRHRFVWALVRALWRNWLEPPGPAAPARLRTGDALWFRMAGLDQVAVEQRWEGRPLVLRRDRATFRRLLSQSLHLVWRVVREGAPVAAAWRAEMPRLTTPASWRRHLGLSPTAAGAGPRSRRD